MKAKPDLKKAGEKKIKPPEVEVASLQRRTGRKLSGGTFKPGFATVFGLAVAVGWHYLHQAGEIYQPSPADPQFWFHLVVEGTIALYAAFFYLIIWKLWQKFK